MSRLRLKTRIKEDNLKKAQEEGHITQDQAEEVKRTEGRYNPYTDTYLNTDVLPEITITAKAPKRTWTSEWSYNDPEFRLIICFIISEAFNQKWHKRSSSVKCYNIHKLRVTTFIHGFIR